MRRPDELNLARILATTLFLGGLSSLSWSLIAKRGPVYELVSPCACCCGHEWTCIAGLLE